MTLQSSFSSSDPLCLSEIKTEFSSISSDCLTGFYGAEAGVPVSGLICMADLLGKGQAWFSITVDSGGLGYSYTSGALGNYGSLTTNATYPGHGAQETVMLVEGHMLYNSGTSTFEADFWAYHDHPSDSSKNVLTTSSSTPFFYTGYTGFQVRNASGTVLWAPSATSTYTWGQHPILEPRQVMQFRITNAQNAGSATSGAGFTTGDTIYVFMTKNSAHIA